LVGFYLSGQNFYNRKLLTRENDSSFELPVVLSELRPDQERPPDEEVTILVGNLLPCLTTKVVEV